MSHSFNYLMQFLFASHGSIKILMVKCKTTCRRVSSSRECVLSWSTDFSAALIDRPLRIHVLCAAPGRVIPVRVMLSGRHSEYTDWLHQHRELDWVTHEEDSCEMFFGGKPDSSFLTPLLYAPLYINSLHS